MKSIIKFALTAASALTVAGSAHAAYNGDLLLGFTGGASDFIYDLGKASTLFQGETWTVGANLGAQYGVIGTLNLGSVVYSTSSDPAQNGYTPTGNFTSVRGNVSTVAGSLTLAGQSRTTTSSDTTGWTFQTAQPPGTPGNTFQNNWYNPNVAVGSTAYFFNNTDTSGGAVTPNSFFTYDATAGVLTFGAVPEPSTYGLLAGMGVLLLAVRRHFVQA